MFQMENGEYPTMGEIFFNAKQDKTNVTKVFVLFGDPALRLAYPKNNVVLTKINGKPVSPNNDTILQNSQLNGHPLEYCRLSIAYFFFFRRSQRGIGVSFKSGNVCSEYMCFGVPFSRSLKKDGMQTSPSYRRRWSTSSYFSDSIVNKGPPHTVFFPIALQRSMTCLVDSF